MKYTAKYFKDNMPEWKRKKDAFVVQKFYRPLSFYGSSLQQIMELVLIPYHTFP